MIWRLAPASCHGIYQGLRTERGRTQLSAFLHPQSTPIVTTKQISLSETLRECRQQASQAIRLHQSQSQTLATQQQKTNYNSGTSSKSRIDASNVHLTSSPRRHLPLPQPQNHGRHPRAPLPHHHRRKRAPNAHPANSPCTNPLGGVKSGCTVEYLHPCQTRRFPNDPRGGGRAAYGYRPADPRGGGPVDGGC